MDKSDDKRPHPSGAAPLAEQNDALGFYLDSLLMDLPEELPNERPGDMPQAAAEKTSQETLQAMPTEPAKDEMPLDAGPARETGGKSTSPIVITTNDVGKAAVTTPLSAQRPPPPPVQTLKQSVAVGTVDISAKSANERAVAGATERTVAIPRDPVSRRPASASVIPLEIPRKESAHRPFAEPPSPQSLLAAPPVLPLLSRDVLTRATKPAVAKAVVKVAVKAPVKAPCKKIPPASPVKTGAKVQPETPVPSAPESPAPVSESPSRVAAAKSTPAAEAPLDAPSRKTPDWAQNRFQCLSFVVAGLTLAAPLEKLHGIVEWQAEITELPGYASWFMGLLQNRGENVRIIDTAQIIMPDGRRPDARPVLERIKYVVLIDDGRWGLAVDSIGQVLTLETDGVRWRGERSKRPWLAGTAVEQMCAVLDIDSLSEQLIQGLKLDD